MTQWKAWHELSPSASPAPESPDAGSNDDRAPDEPWQRDSDPGHRPQTGDPQPGPPADLAGVVLSDGQRVWARIAGDTATLPSGLPLQLMETVDDGITGYRIVEVVDARRSLVRVLPLESPADATREPPDPGEVWPAAPAPADPERCAAFPVGAGAGLTHRHRRLLLQVAVVCYLLGLISPVLLGSLF